MCVQHTEYAAYSVYISVNGWWQALFGRDEGSLWTGGGRHCLCLCLLVCLFVRMTARLIPCGCSYRDYGALMSSHPKSCVSACTRIRISWQTMVLLRRCMTNLPWYMYTWPKSVFQGGLGGSPPHNKFVTDYGTSAPICSTLLFFFISALSYIY